MESGYGEISEEAIRVSSLGKILCQFRLNSIDNSEDEQKETDLKDFSWQKFT